MDQQRPIGRDARLGWIFSSNHDAFMDLKRMIAVEITTGTRFSIEEIRSVLSKSNSDGGRSIDDILALDFKTINMSKAAVGFDSSSRYMLSLMIRATEGLDDAGFSSWVLPSVPDWLLRVVSSPALSWLGSHTYMALIWVLQRWIGGIPGRQRSLRAYLEFCNLLRGFGVQSLSQADHLRVLTAVHHAMVDARMSITVSKDEFDKLWSLSQSFRSMLDWDMSLWYKSDFAVDQLVHFDSIWTGSRWRGPNKNAPRTDIKTRIEKLRKMIARARDPSVRKQRSPVNSLQFAALVENIIRLIEQAADVGGPSDGDKPGCFLYEYKQGRARSALRDSNGLELVQLLKSMVVCPLDLARIPERLRSL